MFLSIPRSLNNCVTFQVASKREGALKDLYTGGLEPQPTFARLTDTVMDWPGLSGIGSVRRHNRLRPSGSFGSYQLGLIELLMYFNSRFQESFSLASQVLKTCCLFVGQNRPRKSGKFFVVVEFMEIWQAKFTT